MGALTLVWSIEVIFHEHYDGISVIIHGARDAGFRKERKGVLQSEYQSVFHIGHMGLLTPEFIECELYSIKIESQVYIKLIYTCITFSRLP